MPPRPRQQPRPVLATPVQPPAAGGPSGAEDFISALGLGDGLSTSEPDPAVAPVAVAPAPAPEPAPAPAPAPEPEPAPAPSPAPAPAPTAAPEGIPLDVLPQMHTPTPVAAPLDDRDIPDPPDIQGDPKANEAWQRVKRERREFRDKLKDAQAELERLRSTALPEHSELETLRQQVSEYEQKIGQYDLSATRSFKQTFDAPLADLKRRAASLLARTGRDPAEAAQVVDKIMGMAQDGEFNLNEVQEAISDEALSTQGALISAVNDYADLAKRRQEALAHFKDTRAALKENESRTEEFQLAQDIERDTQVALGSVLADGNWMYAQSADPKWNAEVANRVSAVKGIVRSASPDELVKWVMEGVSAKRTRELLILEAQKSHKLKTDMDALVAATPRFFQASPGSTPRPAHVAPRDPVDFISEHLSDLRPAMVGRR